MARIGLGVLVLVCMTWVAPAPGAGRESPTPHPSCNLCHGFGDDPSPPATRTAATRAKRIAVCVNCHSDVLSESLPGPPLRAVGAWRSGHVLGDGQARPATAPGGGEFAALDCLSCHSPHPNGRPSQLRAVAVPVALQTGGPRIDAVSQSCIGCHRAFGEFTLPGGDYGIHPVGVTASPLPRAGSPLTPVVDVLGTPSPSDDVVACTTCHQVHNGVHPYMLRWAPADAGHACGNCHSQGRRNESPEILAAR